ncbi:BamA/TamA family outer membrane protein [Siphonobacter sp. SORGH_AS_0500]|uniref:BamA/TamA family outer membrane protein n=1 Tax=Siphonobacter sp. SORGH_AS_0500 TaxID=1864824 RepID=UPI00286478F7|nr:BamA/TamA family outer membrane protein [Siphonobacter sp. SORGH_AS_0500]MDR6197948.1 hypothetical protein [Siphonobacter sp. SORGH_AS_0500]
MNTFLNLYKLIAFLGLAFFLSSGLTYAQQTRPDSVRHRLVLIGDAGRLYKGKNPVVDAVRNRYSFDDPHTTLLYLGDNVYPRGLSDSSSPDYDSLTTILRYQAALGLNKSSQVLFIPGNHDWSKDHADGWEKIKRQGQWLDSLHAPHIQLLPKGGCPGPELVNLNDHLVLIIIDTQWWLHPNEKPGKESDCACKTQDEVVARLSELVYLNKDKGIILATHQPFRSYGIHGGYYTLKQHIFPLTDINPKLYIPLPLIGSIYPIARGVFGTVQDLPNPIYKHMAQVLEKALEPAPNVVFVSGHDHALQHIVDHNRNFIVSGSGINRERVKKGKKASFVSGEWGYVVLDELTDGRVRSDFYTVNEAAEATLAHSATLFRINLTTPSNSTRTPTQTWPDSVHVSIASDYDKVSRFHRLLFGENYRKTWATPVSFPVFDINKVEGGFTILQRGGGQQTKSLRLKDASGKEWVLRTIQKAPEKALPDYLRQTVARDVIQDQISAAFPFAPLVVPVLAEAAAVPHAHPRLFFVPDDPALGMYGVDFANTVCLLEERNPDSDKSVSTPKLLEALQKDNDNQVDQQAVLEARLLDLLIGDWDRHEDQWRWISHKTKNGKVYQPVPRDRDQVFFKSDGLFPYIASRSWIQPKFQGFRENLSNVNGFMYNARYFDRLFLNNLSQADWEKTIAKLQSAWSDAVFEKAIQTLPDPIRRQSGDEILKTLKARRDRLQKYGLTYYRFLAKEVDIAASDKMERFSIEHQNDGKIALHIFKIGKDSTLKQQLYSRLFDPKQTREIRVYGQAGNDQFIVTGKSSRKIKIRMIGGPGLDRYQVNESKKCENLIYDLSTENNTFPSSQNAQIHTSTSASINHFDAHAFQYDRLAPLASAGFNVDDGVLLGAGFQLTKHHFRKAPYASMNRLLISHALATNATAIKYDGIFTNVLGKNDLWINAILRAPDNVTNFFGIGNETAYDKNRRIRYYRTRYDLSTVAVTLKRNLSQQVQVTAGPVFQYFNVDLEDNRGRFLEDYLYTLPENRTFLRQQAYAGFQASFLIDNRNHPTLPTRGLHWDTRATTLQGFGNDRNHLSQFTTDLSIHASFSQKARFVIVNRLGGGLTYGNPAFYQLQYLGGQDNLRGFRKYRFAGDKMVYHNIELRTKLFDFNSYLFPGTVGLTLFNDVGRVWARNETSQKWHDGYGAGLYISPAQLLIFNASVAFSNEGALPYASLGFRF